MVPLREFVLPEPGTQGRFGAIRKHDIHTGLDLYCKEGDEVYAIEDGEVLDVFPFTGPEAESPWWKDTKGITIKGKSGVILYGELNPFVEPGDLINKGEMIGTIATVLKLNKRLPMNMLHLELYDEEYNGQGEWWKLNEDKPKHLLDPTTIIMHDLHHGEYDGSFFVGIPPAYNKSKRKRFNFNFDFNFDIDFKFFAIIPALNLNFHNRFTIEFEWLCFAIYIDCKK